MPDVNPDNIQSKAAKPKTAAAFNPGTANIIGKDIDLTGLAPQQEPEPVIEKGIDLSGKPKIVFAAGRGKTGKTTLLRWVAEMSADREGTAILADIDPTNANFSRYFDDVARPDTDNPAGVTRWLQALIEHCITERQSAIVDLGGGDTTLRTLAGEMPGLGAHIEAAGLALVMLYMVGTQPEDLTPALTLSERGFSAKAQALVLNEAAIDAGSTRNAAFTRVTATPSFLALSKSSVTVWMPKFFAAEAVESRQCRFLDARDGKIELPLGIFDAARLKAWLDAMNRRFAGVQSWIP